MLSNAGVVLRGSSVCLVPYRREHVRTYHGWMQAEDMLAHTCSERLTLQEELDNQRSWHQERGPRLDETKLTFIICARGARGGDGDGARGGGSGSEGNAPPSDLTEGMAGDVNIFLSEIIADPLNEDEEGQPTGKLSAELEVMIAVPSLRRRGLACEALLLLIGYTLRTVPRVDEFVAKVNDDNEPSLRLFTERLGFSVRRHLHMFEQTELVLPAEAARELAERAWREAGACELRVQPEEEV